MMRTRIVDDNQEVTRYMISEEKLHLFSWYLHKVSLQKGFSVVESINCFGYLICINWRYQSLGYDWLLSWDGFLLSFVVRSLMECFTSVAVSMKKLRSCKLPSFFEVYGYFNRCSNPEAGLFTSTSLCWDLIYSCESWVWWS